MNDLPGPLLAEGKDAQIFDLGDGSVLRRAFDRRSLAAEATVMDYARKAGVPVPAVHEVTPDGAIVLDRVDGPSLLHALLSGQVSTEQGARIVTDLHDLVHAVAAPPGLRTSGLAGDRLLHLDLHVFNIVLTSDGPVLIDWANARSGPAEADLAMSWFLHGAGGPGEDEELGRLRRSFLRALLPLLDLPAIAPVIATVAEWRAADRNIGEAEAAVVRKLGTAFPELP